MLGIILDYPRIHLKGHLRCTHVGSTPKTTILVDSNYIMHLIYKGHKIQFPFSFSLWFGGIVIARGVFGPQEKWS